MSASLDLWYTGDMIPPIWTPHNWRHLRGNPRCLPTLSSTLGHWLQRWQRLDRSLATDLESHRAVACGGTRSPPGKWVCHLIHPHRTVPIRD